MSKDRNPKTLTLPEPAAGLWKASRDALSELMPEEGTWERHLGGGTILAARWDHRESTDIDIVMRSVFSLDGLAEPGRRLHPAGAAGRRRAGWRCGPRTGRPATSFKAGRENDFEDVVA